MKSAIVKRLSLVIVLIFLILLLLFPVGTFSANASELNDSNYIMTYYFQKRNGEFVVGTEVGIDFKNLSDQELEIATFQERLKFQLDKLLEIEKRYIFEKYDSSEDEMFSPSEHIKFEETYISLEDNFAVYYISFSSFEVYNQYYQDIVLKENINSFLLRKESYHFDNPFYLNGNYRTNKNEEILSSVLLASEGLSFENQFRTSYNPDYYLDFLADKSKARTNANYFGVDSDNYYHYIWKLNSDNNLKNLYINLTFINYGWWYLLGLGVPLLVMGFAIIVTKVKVNK